MIFRTRKIVKPADLNSNNTLFGGQLLRWVDEEAAVYACCQLDTHLLVTKYISEIDFVAPVRQGEIVEIGVDVNKFGRTSIDIKAVVRNKDTGKIVVAINSIVFVTVNKEGKPIPHGKTECKKE